MGKYIIELEDNESVYKTIIKKDPMIQAFELLSPIPYTAPDLEQVRKEAYQQGYEQGYKDGYNEPGKGKTQVGDEVGLNDGSKGVVTRILMKGNEQSSAYVVWADGYVGLYDLSVLQKTGKHYSEMTEVLHKMGEGE